MVHIRKELKIYNFASYLIDFDAITDCQVILKFGNPPLSFFPVSSLLELSITFVLKGSIKTTIPTDVHSVIKSRHATHVNSNGGSDNSGEIT